MVASVGIALLSTESDTAKVVSAALETSAGIQLRGVYSDLPHLVRYLEHNHVPAVLVDVSSNPVDMIKALAPVIPQFPETRFILLGDGIRNDLVIEAMEIGARYFLLKESIPDNLVSILRRLIVDGASQDDRKGNVVTVLSAGGGCGSTTVAINLANELHISNDKAALLVDLDCAYGSVATDLGIQGKYGIADVLTHDGSIDPALISSSALAYSEGLHVLISPASVDFNNPVSLQEEHLAEAVDACKHAYDYTVIDAPRVSRQAAECLAKESVVTIICFQLTVKDVRLVRAIISSLQSRGVATSSILPLANRYRKRGTMLTMDEVRQALGNLTIEQAANDFKSAIRCINYGQPLAEASPRSLLRKDLRRIAARINSIAKP